MKTEEGGRVRKIEKEEAAPASRRRSQSPRPPSLTEQVKNRRAVLRRKRR
jgi:hypothetical protein